MDYPPLPKSPLDDLIPAAKKLKHYLLQTTPEPEKKEVTLRGILRDRFMDKGMALKYAKQMFTASPPPDIQYGNVRHYLYWAMKNDYPEIAEFLIEKVNVNELFVPSWPEARHMPGEAERSIMSTTLLGEAINEGHFGPEVRKKTVQFLLEHGADPNMKFHICGNEREPPLIAAIREQKYDLAALLVDHGADLNAKLNGKTVTELLQPDSKVRSLLKKHLNAVPDSVAVEKQRLFEKVNEKRKLIFWGGEESPLTSNCVGATLNSRMLHPGQAKKLLPGEKDGPAFP